MLKIICISRKLFNGILTVTSLKVSTAPSSGLCFNIVSGFTDFYFVFEDLFVESETSDMNTVALILRSVPDRFK